MERFTYTVSHDLKTPLVTIRGFLGLVLRDARGHPEQREQDVLRIEAATDRMQKSLDQLLELSRVGRVMNAPEELEFAEVVREAADPGSASS
jgi:signal transduction histidine kinase